LLALLLCLALPAHAEQNWGLCQVWPQPSFEPAATSISPELTPININADYAELKDQQSLTLTGHVHITRGNQRWQTNNAFYDQINNTLASQAPMRYDTESFSATSNRASFGLENNTGKLSETEYFLFERHARGKSRQIELTGDERIILKGASFTTCDPGHEDWSLNGTTVTLNHNTGMGSAFNAYVKFKGVPFFYFPYLSFPITGERTSGFLAPSIGSSDIGGNEIALPYYWNIHPQADATITPHNYTRRGLQLTTELRYLSRLGKSTLTGEYLDDQVYGSSRRLTGFEHRGRFDNGWQLDLQYQQVSDDEYYDDFGGSLSSTSVSHIERYAKLAYHFDQGNISLNLQDFQTIDASIIESRRPYRRLPQLSLNYRTTDNDAVYEMGITGEYVRFQRQGRLTGNRLDLTPYVSAPLEHLAGFIKPKLSLRYTAYDLDENSAVRDDYQISRAVPIYNIDAGIFLERDTHLLERDFIHTLEPRLFYLYVPYRDQQDLPIFDTAQRAFNRSYLFQENRFSGADRMGDTHQLTLALSSRLLESSNGKERLSATIGQIIYFDDRQVSLNTDSINERSHSNVIIEASAKLGQHLSLRSNFIWDTEYDLITKRDHRIQYKDGNRRIVNLSYRYLGNTTLAPDSQQKELDLSMLWPINPSWSMIARRYHSLPDDRTLEKLLGIEYSSCCWAFRVVRRAIYDENTADANNGNGLRYGWMAQLELKGLTSIGQRIEELMQDSIIGYSAIR